MFNLGWAELLVIVVVSIIAIGPKELPTIMRTLGRAVRRLQYMKYALSQQFEDFLHQQDLEELRRDANYRPSSNPDAEKEDDENEHTSNTPPAP